MPRIASPLARNLEALTGVLWWLFLVWSAVVIGLWTSLTGEADVQAWIGNPGLRSALILVVHIADPVWLTLSAAVLYLELAEREGLSTARRWALLILGAATVVGSISAWSGYPLGPVRYTTRLGMKIGAIPVGWPLLWFIIVAGGRQIAESILPRWDPLRVALATGSIALLTLFNLEPIAKLRGLWLWVAAERIPFTHPPAQNYLTWFVVATMLAGLLQPARVTPLTDSPSWRAIWVLSLLNLACLAVHLRLAIRG